MRIYRVEIRELLDGWRCVWSYRRASVCKTAAGALRSVRRAQAQMAQGSSSAVIIDWYPITKIGRQVVEALQ